MFFSGVDWCSALLQQLLGCWNAGLSVSDVINFRLGQVITLKWFLFGSSGLRLMFEGVRRSNVHQTKYAGVD